MVFGNAWILKDKDLLENFKQDKILKKNHKILIAGGTGLLAIIWR